MNEDEYQTAKIGAERLRDYLFEIARRAMVPGNPKDMLKPDDLKALCNGGRFLENGFRDLTRIVDQSSLGTLGHEAIQMIIRGTVLIGCVALYTDSQKDFIGRQKSSRGGALGSTPRVTNKITWQDHVRERVADLYRGNHGRKATVIRNLIKKEKLPPGIQLPNDIYEFVRVELKDLKAKAKDSSG